jgi:predicted lipoprotein with Yx(FWY)xxD motif
MKRRITLLAAPLALLVALVIAGCGGSSDNVKASAPAASATPATSSGGKATIGTRKGSIGTFLVDSQGRTLYLFEKDKGSTSTCSGACATEWPPAPTKGQPKAGSGVEAAQLGTTTRSDGVTQVTYAGHPLYRYLGDQAPGDTNGEGLDDFGGGWDVVAPSGQKIEGDESSASSSQTSSGW